ncbi:MAG: hypothetical protein ACTSUY_11620 [Alphaproteobacteria bacterium]
MAAIGLLVFFKLIPSAHSQQNGVEPERIIADYRQVGAEQRAIITKMKSNLGEKRTLEDQYKDLDTQSENYGRDVKLATAFCKGTFSQEEFRRRTDLCDAKQIDLDQRQDAIARRRSKLDVADKTRRIRARKLKANYGALAKRAGQIEKNMAQHATLGRVAATCLGKKKSSARRFCIEQRWLSASQEAARAEQEKFTIRNKQWRQRQAGLVRASAKRDKWRKEILASLEDLRPPSPKIAPKDLADLKPGDVILLAPTLSFDISNVIPPADWIYRVATSLASGESLRSALPTPGEVVSHTAAVVKSVNGTLLFLDHTLEGSRILSRDGFEKKYGARGIYVARPVLPVDGDKLWQSARKAALREKSDYGIRGKNVVCSERIGIVLSQAIGKSLEARRLGPIDITPGDFFDKKRTGKFFVVSSLDQTPSGQ